MGTLVSRHFLRRTARAKAKRLRHKEESSIDPGMCTYFVRKTYGRLYRWGVFEQRTWS